MIVPLITRRISSTVSSPHGAGGLPGPRGRRASEWAAVPPALTGPLLVLRLSRVREDATASDVTSSPSSGPSTRRWATQATSTPAAPPSSPADPTPQLSTLNSQPVTFKASTFKPQPDPLLTPP